MVGLLLLKSTLCKLKITPCLRITPGLFLFLLSPSPPSLSLSFFLKFIYVFLVALGLRCCVRAFLKLRSAGFSLQCLLLLRGARTLGASGFSSCGWQALRSSGAWALVVLGHVESACTRDRTGVRGLLTTVQPEKSPLSFFMSAFSTRVHVP